MCKNVDRLFRKLIGSVEAAIEGLPGELSFFLLCLLNNNNNNNKCHLASGTLIFSPFTEEDLINRLRMHPTNS
jgi:hypothetical protein